MSPLTIRQPIIAVGASHTLMENIKKRNIFLGAGLLLLIALSFIFYWWMNNLRPEGDNYVADNSAISGQNLQEFSDKAVATTTTESLDNIYNINRDKANHAKYLAEFKRDYPQYSDEQLADYADKASNKEMVSCRGRADENDCIFATAFITRIDDFCGEIQDLEDRIACSNTILSQKAPEEIDKCRLLEQREAQSACLINIFYIYQAPDDCALLMTDKLRISCLDSVYYRQAVYKQNEGLCYNINDQAMRQYCLDTLSSNIDTDSDGLSDYQEENIYNTDLKNPDTDGDGYLDGDEVRNGFNPAGPGPLVNI